MLIRSSTSPLFFSTTPTIRSSSLKKCRSFPTSQPPLMEEGSSRTIRIAVVGDVHDDWDLQEDGKALDSLKGDFGDENVELVRSVSKLELPKAVILGNHDCWKTKSFSAVGKDNVQLQLESLGEDHVGFRRIDFSSLRLSVVGCRPFSCGGDRICGRQLISERYGVQDMKASAERILEIAQGTPEGHSIIFLAHNGPRGLGSKGNDICGKDWSDHGGDHGDKDLQEAIQKLMKGRHSSSSVGYWHMRKELQNKEGEMTMQKSTSKRFSAAPLVVFGHMHKELQNRQGKRTMIKSKDGVIYLNGAVIPRVQQVSIGESKGNTFPAVTELSESQGTLRVFTVVEMLEGNVLRIAETWVSVSEQNCEIAKEFVIYQCKRECTST